MLMNIPWARSPSGVYQSQGDGKYVLLPIGSGCYAVQVWGETMARVDALDLAKNWCEEDRHKIGHERAVRHAGAISPEKTVPDVFPNPGITSVALTMVDVPGRCLLVDDVCAFDVLAWYGPRQECVTMAWFAATVRALTAERTTAEQLAVALRAAFRQVIGDAWARVKVRHHEKDGVELEVEV